MLSLLVLLTFILVKRERGRGKEGKPINIIVKILRLKVISPLESYSGISEHYELEIFRLIYQTYSYQMFQGHSQFQSTSLAKYKDDLITLLPPYSIFSQVALWLNYHQRQTFDIYQARNSLSIWANPSNLFQVLSYSLFLKSTAEILSCGQYCTSI